MKAGDIAERESVDRIVEIEGGGIADDGADILDADDALVGGVEAELADLAAAEEPVAADELDERSARFIVDGEPGGACLLVDEAVEVAGAVGEAGDRGSRFVALCQAAEWRGLPKIARGYHDPGVDRWGGENRFDGRDDRSVAGDAHRDGAPAAEERDGVRLVRKLAGIVREIIDLEAHMSEWIVGAPGHRLDESRRPLGDEAFLAVNEDDANRGIGPREEAIGFGRLDFHHA